MTTLEQQITHLRDYWNVPEEELTKLKQLIIKDYLETKSNVVNSLYVIQKISTGFILNYETEYYNESAPQMCTLVDYETTEGIWVTHNEKRAKEVLYFSNSIYCCDKEFPRHSLVKEDLQITQLKLDNKLPNLLLEFKSLESIVNYIRLNGSSLDNDYKESIEELICNTQKNHSNFKKLQDSFLHYLSWSNLI